MLFTLFNITNMSPKPSLLLIEADEGLQRLLGIVLGEEYEVTITQNALEGLQHIYQGNLPQLLVIDLNIEGISGWELIQQINTNGLLRDIPIVVLGNKQQQYIESKLPEQVKSFLLKPFDPDQLKHEIQQYSLK